MPMTMYEIAFPVTINIGAWTGGAMLLSAGCRFSITRESRAGQRFLGNFDKKRKCANMHPFLDVFAHFLRSYWQLTNLFLMVNTVPYDKNLTRS